MLRLAFLSFVVGLGLVSGFTTFACGSDDSSAANPSNDGTPSSSSPFDGGVTSDPANDAAITDGNVSDAGSGAPKVIFPRTGIEPDELGVVINDKDPLSAAIADYYVTARKIPAANVVHVSFTVGPVISDTTFGPAKTLVDTAFAGTKVQALLLTWATPYRVNAMSITSAFALGYKEIATSNTCNDPNSMLFNPYLQNMDSTAPFTDLGFRPAMTIPATTLADAKALIDRGIASDGTSPKGYAYLMKTKDGLRSARCVLNPTYGYTNECQTFLDSWDTAGTGIGGSIVDADSITNKNDVLFYVEGLVAVPDLATNTYLPGAIADHLTSHGGTLPDSGGQMSANDFLRAGATASFGTVVEPCAYTQKFPDPSVLIPTYFGGQTLIEAYWKSVKWPTEGVFIGEPLARPFGPGYWSSFEGGTLTITTTAMHPGIKYVIEAADAESGPFTAVQANLTVAKYTRATFTVPNAVRAVYRFRKQ